MGWTCQSAATATRPLASLTASGSAMPRAAARRSSSSLRRTAITTAGSKARLRLPRTIPQLGRPPAPASAAAVALRSHLLLRLRLRAAPSGKCRWCHSSLGQARSSQFFCVSCPKTLQGTPQSTLTPSLTSHLGENSDRYSLEVFSWRLIRVFAHCRCNSDTLAGCDAPSEYYRAMLDTYFFWQQTWKREGRMEVSLPHRNDTDGAQLAAQARYALVLDMITRTGQEFWPRYGTAPGCEYCFHCLPTQLSCCD